jgi:hypothetical protein
MLITQRKDHEISEMEMVIIKNGNTVTDQAASQGAEESGFDVTQEQESQNVICTHPNDNASCSQEGITSVPIPLPMPTTPPPPTTGTLLVRKVVVCMDDGQCPSPSEFTITVESSTGRKTTFPGSETGNGVTLEQGQFFVNEDQSPAIFTVSFSGDCTQAGQFTASGTIIGGEHKTCIITNTETTGTLLVRKQVPPVVE